MTPPNVIEHVVLGWALTNVRLANVGERAGLGRLRPALRERMQGYC